MKIIKKTKYLYFSEEPQRKLRSKTKLIAIINISSGSLLGTIEWYGTWRQYCFIPTMEFDTVWNNTCLADIISVINDLMKERTIEKPKGE